MSKRLPEVSSKVATEESLEDLEHEKILNSIDANLDVFTSIFEDTPRVPSLQNETIGVASGGHQPPKDEPFDLEVIELLQDEDSDELAQGEISPDVAELLIKVDELAEKFYEVKKNTKKAKTVSFLFFSFVCLSSMKLVFEKQ